MRDNSFCFIMARKTASLQKRLKKSSKKRSAATTAERASSTTESDKIKTGYKDTPSHSMSLTIKSTLNFDASACHDLFLTFF